MIVAVDSVFGSTPVTVMTPFTTVTTPPAVAVPDQSQSSLSLVNATVKPSAVGSGVPKVGMRAALSEVSVTLAEPCTESVRLAVTVTVSSTFGSSPVTTTEWVLFSSSSTIAATPGEPSGNVAAQVYWSS